MIRTIEDEDKIVRWTFAEIMSYFRRTHHPRSRWFRYNPGHMKVHKILYQTFESAEVPVTRSWYRYGCFIHSNQLAGFRDFSTLKNNYLRGPREHPRLQSAVARMGFNVHSIKKALYENIDKMPPRMSRYVITLYQNAPEKFGNIYITKLDLHNTLRRSEKVTFENPVKFQSWLSKVRRNLSVFHMSAFSCRQFDDLKEIVMGFTLNVEEALLRVQQLIRLGKKMPKRKKKLIHEFSDFFDNQVWFPFALEISARTVKGFRETQIRDQQLRKKKETIEELANLLKRQYTILTRNDLVMSWTQHRDRLEQLEKDETLAKAVAEMEKIYDRSSEVK